MSRRFAVIIPICLASACATPGHAYVSLRPERRLEGPKEVAIAGRRGEVERTLEEYLREEGFRVKRYASVARVTEAVGEQKAESYDASSTRYLIETDWSIMDQCFGGGFRFNFVQIDVVDTRSNEVVVSARANGYSEKCQPLSGTIFSDFARAISAGWKAEESRATDSEPAGNGIPHPSSETY